MIHKKLIALGCTALFLSSQALCSDSGRDFYNYELKDGHRIVYIGQTNDPARREAEHRSDKSFTHMNIIGYAKTYEGSINTEREALERYRDGHGGRNPPYNKTDHG